MHRDNRWRTGQQSVIPALRTGELGVGFLAYFLVTMSVSPWPVFPGPARFKLPVT